MKPIKFICIAAAVALAGCLTGNMLDKALIKAAEELNKNCPFMVDSETRLDNAMALPDKKLVYFYTMVNYVKDEIDVDVFAESMTPTIINAVSTNTSMEFLRKQKVTFSYQYKDKNGEFFWTLDVTPDMYENHVPIPVFEEAAPAPDTTLTL
ncbi:MAG: hypothetical protein LBH06_03410 [Rikenellaceae bacterium]|jgi:hypothetical protein|nr:hypothetical protein [Rikenellaceae bacterium]